MPAVKGGLSGAAALPPQTRIKATAENFHLTAAVRFRVTEEAGTRDPYRVTTTAYYYSLLDAAEKEIIAYHWHPHGNVTFPHLHICSGARVGRADLRNAHIPTGRVSMADLLRMVITEFGVAPRRADWADVLAQSQTAYEQWRS